MTHARLVEMAERWLRRARCGIVLSEQGCASGEMPDAIGWKGKNHSIVVECKISRADFLADAAKSWRKNPEIALGCERYYAAPKAMLRADEIEMNLLLASLRRVEVRIEPQRIADFLKWKNRMAAYNGGTLPEGIVSPEREENPHLI